MKKARIENGRVAEILEADPFPPFHPSLVWVPCGDVAEGDLYDGTNFTKPVLSPEQRLATAKAQRRIAVEAIKVTTASGKEFDGDENSQTRMARAILALQATGAPSVKWVLANNVPTMVTAAELVEALALAGAAQAAVWSEPYEGQV